MLLITPRYPLKEPLPIVIDLPTFSSYSYVLGVPKPGLATLLELTLLPTFSMVLATTTQLSAFSTTIPLVLSNSGLNKKQ